MTPADLARRLYLDQCRHNDLSSYGERAAVAAMVPLIEALQGQADALGDLVAYNKALRDKLAEMRGNARAALTPQPEEVA